MTHGVTPTLQELTRLRQHAARLGNSPDELARAGGSGNYLSSFRGRGMEFSEVRRYVPGDDVRTIDWRVTARTGTPHTKLFQEERERPVVLLVDQSATMQFGTRRAFKSYAAAEAAALLAWAAAAKGDRVGGLVFADTQHREVRPVRGQRGALNLLRAICDHDMSNRQTAHDDSIPAWYSAITRAQRIAKPGTWIGIISDFERAETLPQAESNLMQLSRHCELALIFLSDPLEKALPPPGLYSFSDGEKLATVDSAIASLREQHTQRFAARSAQLDHWRRRLGLRFIELSTADDPMQRLRAGLHIRRQRIAS